RAPSKPCLRALHTPIADGVKRRAIVLRATAVSPKPLLFPTRRRFLGMSAAAGASLTSLGCGSVPKPGATPMPAAADVPAARKAGPPSPDAEALFAQMTLDEKIGQMTQADMKALKDGKEVHTYLLGSVLSGADSLPKPNEPATWVELYDRLQGQALST